MDLINQLGADLNPTDKVVPLRVRKSIAQGHRELVEMAHKTVYKSADEILMTCVNRRKTITAIVDKMQHVGWDGMTVSSPARLKNIALSHTGKHVVLAFENCETGEFIGTYPVAHLLVFDVLNLLEVIQQVIES